MLSFEVNKDVYTIYILSAFAYKRMEGSAGRIQGFN